MASIAILTPIHRRPDLILDQLSNYASAHGDSAVHFLHPSIAGGLAAPSLDVALSRAPIDFRVVARPSQTGWACIYGAFARITEEYASSFGADFDQVYIHTDADLIVGGNFRQWCSANPLAYSATPLAAENHWFRSIQQDDRFRSLRHFLDVADEDVVGGRQEGAMFPVDLWLEAVRIIGRYYDESFFSDSSLYWPLEEYVLPTVIKSLAPDASAGQILVRTQQMKSTSAPNPRDVAENCVTLEQVKSAAADTSVVCVGMKWFSQDFNDPARVFVREQSAAKACVVTGDE